MEHCLPGTLQIEGLRLGPTPGGAPISTLNAYEEGTWTPFLDRDATLPSLAYNIQVGWYVKIGPLVTAGFNVDVSSVSSQGTGVWRLRGLPFNGPGAARVGGVALGECALFAATGGFKAAATNDIAFITNAGGYVNTSAVTGAIRGSVTYLTAD